MSKFQKQTGANRFSLDAGPSHRWNHSKYQSRSSVSRIRLEITGFGSRFEVSRRIPVTWFKARRNGRKQGARLNAASPIDRKLEIGAEFSRFSRQIRSIAFALREPDG